MSMQNLGGQTQSIMLFSEMAYMAPVCYRQRTYHNNDNSLLRRETGPTVYRPYPRRLERIAHITKAAISPRSLSVGLSKQDF